MCVGIIPQKDYIVAEHILSNDSSRAAGMQGQPQSLDDMTDGQIEDRFYQSVTRTHFLLVSCCITFAVHYYNHYCLQYVWTGLCFMQGHKKRLSPYLGCMTSKRGFSFSQKQLYG